MSPIENDLLVEIRRITLEAKLNAAGPEWLAAGAPPGMSRIIGELARAIDLLADLVEAQLAKDVAP